jgi:hypothetical protein
MPTILELFDSGKKELYNNELIRIDSRGLVNPPRAAALAASSPNSLADLVGGQIAGAINGVANRPSDTIFKGNTPLSKPITITAFTEAGLRDAVEAGTDYTVKQNPSPNSVISAITQGGSSPTGLATNLAIQSLNKFGSKSGLKALGDSLKKKSPNQSNGSFGDPLYTNKKPFSSYIKGEQSDEERTGPYAKTWDNSNEDLLEKESFDNQLALDDWMKRNILSNQVPITFQKYGKSTIIPFVGSISGISEDIQPEWSNYRYVGNPFKTYRYQGVERSVKFNLKLYYRESNSKQTMIKKIEYLKSLAFPDEKLSEFSYSGNQSSQYAFSPNLVFFSIGDLYKNMFGYIESLSFNIEDNTVWTKHQTPNASPDADNSLYPNVIDVSIGIKIIENHGIEDKKFKYNFNGTKVIDKKLIQAKTAAPDPMVTIVNGRPIFNNPNPAPGLQRTKIDVAKIKEENMAKEQEAKFLASTRNMFEPR